MLAVAVSLALFPSTFVVEGKTGPGKGKHIVLLAGDEEYRSEEGLPQLARILAQHHGFKCTVVFSLNNLGEIDPNTQDNQPGIEALDTADLCVMLLRFRRWPDAQMKHFVDYFQAGKPIVALRTSTHAFDFTSGPYASYGWRSADWPGGFGEQVLGENWISHWGDHGRQATRGVLAGRHPILNGVKSVFGTTDVYEAAPPADAHVLMRGEVVEGMTPGDPAATGSKKTAPGATQGINDPMMPIAWTRLHKNESGKINRVFTSTMGAATDMLDEGMRRLIVNACFWGLNMSVPPKSKVDPVGVFKPSSFGFNAFRKGMRPADLTSR